MQFHQNKIVQVFQYLCRKKDAAFTQLYLGEMSKLSIQIKLKMLLKVLQDVSQAWGTNCENKLNYWY